MKEEGFMGLLSCVIITKNEEKNISECLESVRSLANEIIVVDDFSSDKTVEIAKKYTREVYLRKLDLLGGQKKFGISKTTGDWILLLDADERITKALADEIKRSLRRVDYDAYNFYFQSTLFGKVLKPTLSGGQILLFRKNRGKIVSNLIHERVEVKGAVGQLNNPLLHYSYPSVFEVVEKFNRYTNPEAMLAYQRGERTNLFKIVVAIPRVFFWRFFLSGEWRDGSRGFIVSMLFGIYHLLVQLKLWEVQNRERDKFETVKYIPK